MNANDKYKEEHSSRLEDHCLTRRQFLNRAGMGFGALSLAALLGENGSFITMSPVAVKPTTTIRCPLL